MSAVNDGGPAFPILERGGQGLELSCVGMSLRDYFATHADIGDFDQLSLSWGEKLLGRACPDRETPIACFQWWADYRAALRYMEADAMLRAREQTGGAA